MPTATGGAKKSRAAPKSTGQASAPKTKSTAAKKSATSTAKTSGTKSGASVKKPAAKTAARASKTSTAVKSKSKGNAASTSAETNGRKRKSDDDSDADEQASAPKKARVAKARKTPSVRPKVVINEAPSQRLDVFVCGEGSAGELGLGTAKNAVDVKRPRLNPNLPAGSVGVVQVACGGMHAIALTHDGTVLTWGVNDDGALGRDTAWEGGLKDMDDNKSDASDASDESDNGLNPREANPGHVTFPEGTVIVKVAAGDSVSLALTDDGRVFGWGKFRVSVKAIKHIRVND